MQKRARSSPATASACAEAPSRNADHAMPDFSPAELAAIALSLKVACVAALATLPAVIELACLLARRRFPGTALLDALVHQPLVLPQVVVAYALLVVFGSQG